MTKEEAKHLSEILKAYSEGRIIQIHLPSDKWEDTPYPAFDRHPLNYRIKPEPKYRPYNSAEEFLNAQKEHGPHILYDKFGYNVITQINQDSIWINLYQSHQKISFSKLVNYKWQDGTPCGVLENE